MTLACQNSKTFPLANLWLTTTFKFIYEFSKFICMPRSSIFIVSITQYTISKENLKKLNQIQMELCKVSCLGVKKIVRIALLSRNLFKKQVIVACRHTTPRPPSHIVIYGGPVRQPCAGVIFIPQPGTMNWASEQLSNGQDVLYVRSLWLIFCIMIWSWFVRRPPTPFLPTPRSPTRFNSSSFICFAVIF